jgi:hypothetical protein
MSSNGREKNILDCKNKKKILVCLDSLAPLGCLACLLGRSLCGFLERGGAKGFCNCSRYILFKLCTGSSDLAMELLEI